MVRTRISKVDARIKLYPFGNPVQVLKVRRIVYFVIYRADESLDRVKALWVFLFTLKGD